MKLLLERCGAIAHDVMRQKVDTRTIYGELEERLNEELDYVHEARNMTEFGNRFADDRDLMLPQVVKEFSSRRVLTMTYIDGYPLMDVLGTVVDDDLREWVAQQIFTRSRGARFSSSDCSTPIFIPAIIS